MVRMHKIIKAKQTLSFSQADLIQVFDTAAENTVTTMPGTMMMVTGPVLMAAALS